MGMEFVRAHLQQTFLTIGHRRFLRRLSRTCFICRRWRAQNITPMMSDLPHFHFADAEKQYPFLNVGFITLDLSTLRIILASLNYSTFAFSRV